MASKLMKWKTQNLGLGKEIWDALGRHNQTFTESMAHLQILHDRDPDGYFKCLRDCSNMKISSVVCPI